MSSCIPTKDRCVTNDVNDFSQCERSKTGPGGVYKQLQFSPSTSVQARRRSSPASQSPLNLGQPSLPPRGGVTSAHPKQHRLTMTGNSSSCRNKTYQRRQTTRSTNQKQSFATAVKKRLIVLWTTSILVFATFAIPILLSIISPSRVVHDIDEQTFTFLENHRRHQNNKDGKSLDPRSSVSANKHDVSAKRVIFLISPYTISSNESVWIDWGIDVYVKRDIYNTAVDRTKPASFSKTKQTFSLSTSARQQSKADIDNNMEEQYSSNHISQAQQIRTYRHQKNHSSEEHEQEEDDFNEFCSFEDSWQEASFPTCNNLHEFDFEHGLIPQSGSMSTNNTLPLRLSVPQDHIAGSTSIKLTNFGYYRDVWTINTAQTNGDLEDSSDNGEEEQLVVLKTLRYAHKFDSTNHERHRRDAVASERLTASPYITNIYSYCANSGLFEHSAVGDMVHFFELSKGARQKHKNQQQRFEAGGGHDDDGGGRGRRDDAIGSVSKEDRLMIAAQVAMAVSDAHAIGISGGIFTNPGETLATKESSDQLEDESWNDMMDAFHPLEGENSYTKECKTDVESELAGAAIAHTDITPFQFLFMEKDGWFKLNDFNRCQFLKSDRRRRTNSSQSFCPYRVEYNPGPFRSPEEYRYDAQTEKVDVYSMGNVLHFLLTETWWPVFGEEGEDLNGRNDDDMLSSAVGSLRSVQRGSRKSYSDDYDTDDGRGQGSSAEYVSRQVLRGARPKLPRHILRSKDPSVVALRKARDMCYIQCPHERPSAREIRDFLQKAIDEILEGSADSGEKNRGNDNR